MRGMLLVSCVQVSSFANLAGNIEGILKKVCTDVAITKSTPRPSVKLGENITYVISL